MTRRGVVKWFDASKGYGYVIEDGGVDLFCHVRDTVDNAPLEAGQRVQFVRAEGAKGPRAVAVRVMES